MPTTTRRRMPTPRARVTNANRVARDAVAQAAAVAANTSVNRSTRTRASYKVKADALDQVIAILAGKR